MFFPSVQRRKEEPELSDIERRPSKFTQTSKKAVIPRQQEEEDVLTRKQEPASAEISMININELDKLLISGEQGVRYIDALGSSLRQLTLTLTPC